MEMPIPVVFFKKVVLALPQGEFPLRPSCKKQEFLNADEALAVNCKNIINQLQQSGIPIPGPPFEGFIVIEVPPQTPEANEAPELDVVAVYSARRLSSQAGVTIDVEKIEPRRVIGQPTLDDLCLSI